ncbi:uncharacterized protein YacL [Paenibacillus endophyticus]|uniref:Uncharacterized protein YacL n=1 Tax=Paenibacillus endophyticus TaxID=1294268 RepID=A0A7W5GAZ3_9BACL|nr:hypothetical protein [Paenibacillus endophyticus]MBB3152843.1 uncharacterized protein YacL [Paenibacillus endophyticus]
MEKINLENIIKSFFLGIFMGIVLQFYDRTEVLVSYKILTILASGSIGFIIGFITEWLTAILPISIANARVYFFINNLIALVVTIFILAALMLITSSDMEIKQQFMKVLLIVLGIICLANLFDYLMYRRAQNKLKTFKAWIKDK